MGSAPAQRPSGAGWRVVSDVDHTLLEHGGETLLAGHCLRQLHQRGIPTLLASSKTFAEMVAFQTLADLPPQPFLFENGCGIGWPLACWPTARAGEPKLVLGAYGAFVRGADPAWLRVLLLRLRRDGGLRFSLLEELSFDAIHQWLGLEPQLARLALQRLASLPLVWHADDSLEPFQQQLAGEGLRAVSGGRLVHVAPPFDKGEALVQLLAWQGGAPASLQLLACGDSENDRSLLESAAVALVFHPADCRPLSLAPSVLGADAAPTATFQAPRRLERQVIAGGPGPWLEAVQAALSAVGAWAGAETR